jgi:hypothetical protein
MIEIIIRGDNGEVINELDYYDVQHLLVTFEEMVKVYSGNYYGVDSEIESYFLDKCRIIRKRQCN